MKESTEKSIEDKLLKRFFDQYKKDVDQFILNKLLGKQNSVIPWGFDPNWPISKE